MIFSKVTLLLTTLIATKGILTDTVDKKNYADNIQRISGTRNAVNGEFPWMVPLFYNGKFVCSSFLITPKVLMVAAHCVVSGKRSNDPSNYKGYVGIISRENVTSEKAITFSEIIPHPEYTFGTYNDNDIALMKLTQPVKLRKNVQTICLPTEDSTYENMKAQFIGWRPNGFGGKEWTYDILKTTKEEIVPYSTCSLSYSDRRITIHPRHICAINSKNKFVCSCGPGGPLVTMFKNEAVAFGVASFSYNIGCPNDKYPIVFTSTSNYADWIMENAGDDAKDLCFLNTYEYAQTIRHGDYV